MCFTVIEHLKLQTWNENSATGPTTALLLLLLTVWNLQRWYTDAPFIAAGQTNWILTAELQLKGPLQFYEVNVCDPVKREESHFVFLR